MILLDFRPVAVAALAVGISSGFHTDQVTEHSLRSMILSTIKKVVREHSPAYGKLVIASEGSTCWRKAYFPYYKANRKRKTDEVLDWGEVIRVMDLVRDEIAQFMPYASVHADEAEADDVIAVIVRNADPLEPKLVVSGDRDFVQLQALHGVDQWDHVRSRWVTHPDPVAQLKEKIIRGDSGDGVPNFLTEDDVFVTPGKRSKPIMQAKLDVWLKEDPSVICDTDEKKARWERNATLVDFSMIPERVVTAISDRYTAATTSIPPRSGVSAYLMNNRLARLAVDAQDF